MFIFKDNSRQKNANRHDFKEIRNGIKCGCRNKEPESLGYVEFLSLFFFKMRCNKVDSGCKFLHFVGRYSWSAKILGKFYSRTN